MNLHPAEHAEQAAHGAASLREEDGAPPPGWSRFARRYALALLVLSAILNQVDRQVVSILVEPIKREFSLSDSQMGLLTGAAFALVYAFAAFPVGRALDAGPRKAIFSACIVLWSASTAAAGVATSYVGLLVSRIGVAIGESGAVPAQHSMVSDLYPGRRLPMALALITLGSAFGVAASLFTGGFLVEHFGWRTVFVAVGAPGLLLAALLFFGSKEPPRRTLLGDHATEGRPPIGEVIRYLWSLKTYRVVLIAGVLSGISGGALNAWGPSFLIRVHHLTPSQIGLWLGLATALGLGCGALVSGQLSTIMGARDIRWYLGISGTFSILCAPAGLLIALAPTPQVSILAVFFYQFCTVMHVPPTAAIVQSLAKPRMRGMATAATAFTSVLGVGLGPLAMGMLTDAFAGMHGPLAIRGALALIVLAVAVAGAIYLLGNRWVRQEYARVAQSTS